MYLYILIYIHFLILNSSALQSSVQSIHPQMHSIVQKRPEDYLEEDPQLKIFFDRLIRANKKLFLVTNSPFSFV